MGEACCDTSSLTINPGRQPCDGRLRSCSSGKKLALPKHLPRAPERPSVGQWCCLKSHPQTTALRLPRYFRWRKSRHWHVGLTGQTSQEAAKRLSEISKLGPPLPIPHQLPLT